MIKLISTGDGSSSLFVEELNETYHSRHGAIQESEFVFIKEGLEKLDSLAEINVLEVGMGTGLNVLLSSIYAFNEKINVSFTTLEPFPIPNALIQDINYGELTQHARSKSWFEKIHQCDWNQETDFHTYFKFKKHQVKAEEFQSKGKFDIIFYDAFGPHAQPELWHQSIFDHLAMLLHPGSMLVTYCAQGQFKRNLRASGFEVERLPGPPGKREMTRGVYKPN